MCTSLLLIDELDYAVYLGIVSHQLSTNLRVDFGVAEINTRPLL
jgi:hypothetical protein